MNVQRSESSPDPQPVGYVNVIISLGFILIMTLAAYLRLKNLAIAPGWYSDEGTHLSIAKNLMNGEWRYLAIEDSVLLFARLPGFYLPLVGLMRIFGARMVVVRALSVLFELTSIGLVYLLARRCLKSIYDGFALLAALVVGVYPLAVVYARFGFSYHLLTPIVLYSCLASIAYVRSGELIWLLTGSLALGFGMITDIVAVAYLIPFLLTVSVRNRMASFKSLGISLLLPLIYALWCLVKDPGAFIFDVRFSMNRLGEIPLILQIPVVMMNFYFIMMRNAWFLPGILGLFLVPEKGVRQVLAGHFLIPLVLVTRSTGFGSGLEDYYLIPLLPYIGLGMAMLIWKTAPIIIDTSSQVIVRLLGAWRINSQERVASWFLHRLVSVGTLVPFVIVILSPLLMAAFDTLQSIGNGFDTPVDPVLVDVVQALDVVDYLNDKLADTDFVIASPAVAAQFDRQATDFQMAVAFRGEETRHLPTNIPADRFAFDPSPEKAAYVIVDPVWRNWAAPNMISVENLLNEVETWPLEYTSGDIRVYRNPVSP